MEDIINIFYRIKEDVDIELPIRENIMEDIINIFYRIKYRKEYKRLINVFILIENLLTENKDCIIFRNENTILDIEFYNYHGNDYIITLRRKGSWWCTESLTLNNDMFKYIIKAGIHKLDLELIIEEYILEKI
jgi:hypothetical protein